MTMQLLFLEFNEINFENVQFYCRRGQLPNLAALMERNGWACTSSEQNYEDLEPWIQWVTAHTGRTLAEHGVFRLGDIVHRDLTQIWERLEDLGLRVGAISPMNAKHRVRKPAFFVPDPWTRTRITASPELRGLYEAIAQAVNDNAQARVTPGSLVRLLAGLRVYARAENYWQYLRLATGGRAHPWRKAILLDVLLADVFVREVHRSAPHFATLFLNAGAHIQHHYLFSAACYAGSNRNPAWYVSASADPVLEVYEIYDRILGTVRRHFPLARIMLATGLHQDPHGEITYYWRLRRHEAFLRKIGVSFARVEPRMSRDFLIVCADAASATAAAARLSRTTAQDGLPVFAIDNRGTDLFVMLSYPREIGRSFTIRIDDEVFADFERDVVFVALKNGQHNGTGYFLDTGMRLRPSEDTFPLASIPDRIVDALGVGRSPSLAATRPVVAS